MIIQHRRYYNTPSPYLSIILKVINVVYVRRQELRAKILMFLSDGRAYSTRRIQRALGVDRRTLADILKDLYFRHMVSYFERDEQLVNNSVPVMVRYWFRPDKAWEKVKTEMELIKQAQQKEETIPNERVVGKLGTGGERVISDKESGKSEN